MDQFDQDQMRQDFNRFGWAFIAAQLLMLGLSLAGSWGGSLLLQFFSPLRGTWERVQGYIIIVAVVVGTLPMLELCVGNDRMEKMFDRGEKIWPVQLLFYFFIIFGLQIMVNLLTSPLVELLESIGLSFSEANEVATSYSTVGSMLFYAVAVAPVCEEILYRGIILRYLERYGRWFAIFMSAMIFGLMHGNAVQFPIAFVIGMVFAYLAFKYSLRTTILLHVMNNLCVELIGRIVSINQSLGTKVSAALVLAGVISIILVVLSGGKPLLRDLRNNRTQKEVYTTFLKSFPVATVFLYMIMLTVASVVK